MRPKFSLALLAMLMGPRPSFHDRAPSEPQLWITFNTKQAIAHGMKPFFWDTGGMVDRATDTVKDARTVNAIFAGAH